MRAWCVVKDEGCGEEKTRAQEGREAESSHGLRKFRELNPKWGEGAAGVVVPGDYS